MYPNDIVEKFGEIVTVEKAEADLHANMNNECLDVGDIRFDKMRTEYPNYDSYDAIYCFDISVQYELGCENYCAEVIYNVHDSEGITIKKMDIWQVDSTFTEMGKWKYDDGETCIVVDFLETVDTGYIVEYNINYYSNSWANGRWVETVSDGEVTVFGNNEWDGNVHYLSIDLKEFVDENGQKVDRGHVQVYPWDGVYWDTLHVYGGPFRLAKG